MVEIRAWSMLVMGMLIASVPLAGGVRVSAERFHYVIEAHNGFREADVELDPDCLVGAFSWDFYLFDTFLANLCSPWASFEDAYWSAEGVKGQLSSRVTKYVVGHRDVFVSFAVCERHSTDGFDPIATTSSGFVAWSSSQIHTPVIRCQWTPVNENIGLSWAHECEVAFFIDTTLLPEQAAQILGDDWDPDFEPAGEGSEFPIVVKGYTVPGNELIAGCSSENTRAW